MRILVKRHPNPPTTTQLHPINNPNELYGGRYVLGVFVLQPWDQGYGALALADPTLVIYAGAPDAPSARLPFA